MDKCEHKLRRCRKICDRVWLLVRWLDEGVKEAGVCCGWVLSGVGAILYWRSIVYISGAGVQSGDNSWPDLYIWHS